jgi:hypothetical protein
MTLITGSSSDDWIYEHLPLQSLSITVSTTRAYKPYSAIADSQTSQLTVAHKLGFSLSTSHLLATDLSTETITSNHY